MMRRVAFPALTIALASALVGCGPKMGSTSGVVKMDGTPSGDLQVTFEPVGDVGAVAIGFTDPQGKYTLYSPGNKAGAPPGEYVVRIVGVEGDNTPPRSVPSRFNTESDLKRTIEAGTNVFDFEIESK